MEQLVKTISDNCLWVTFACIMLPSIGFALSVMSRGTDKRVARRPGSYPGSENMERIKKKK